MEREEKRVEQFRLLRMQIRGSQQIPGGRDRYQQGHPQRIDENGQRKDPVPTVDL